LDCRRSRSRQWRFLSSCPFARPDCSDCRQQGYRQPRVAGNCAAFCTRSPTTVENRGLISSWVQFTASRSTSLPQRLQVFRHNFPNVVRANTAIGMTEVVAQTSNVSPRGSRRERLRLVSQLHGSLAYAAQASLRSVDRLLVIRKIVARHATNVRANPVDVLDDVAEREMQIARRQRGDPDRSLAASVPRWPAPQSRRHDVLEAYSAAPRAHPAGADARIPSPLLKDGQQRRHQTPRQACLAQRNPRGTGSPLRDVPIRPDGVE
jgi:hypothetical protein